MAYFTVEKAVNLQLGGFSFIIASGGTGSCPDDLFEELKGTIEGSHNTVALARKDRDLLATGTAFPTSPSTNDLFFRTDRRLLYVYDGTRWLSTTLHQRFTGVINNGALTSTTTAERGPSLTDFADIYVEEIHAMAFVSGTNDGSNYWTLKAQLLTPAGSATTLATWDTSAEAGSTFLALTKTAIDTVVTSTNTVFQLRVEKTGTPGSIQLQTSWFYRLVG